MSKKSIFILCFLIISSISYSQKNYLVTKDGSGNFKTIKEVNSAKFNNGDIVSFKSGEQFDDAILECSSGITYNSYGGSTNAIIGNRTSNSFLNTIAISHSGVVIENLIIYGYSNAYTIITYSDGGWALENCKVEGGINSHSVNTIAIKSLGNGYSGMPKITIKNNEFLELARGLYSNRPYNMEISYNKFHELWMYDGRRDAGGNAMSFFTNGLSDRWNAEYTLHIHHNEIYNFEYTAIGVTVSGMLIEYNEIHNNLDERIFRGGVKHGSISKLFDNTGSTLGGLGNIFRYNYVHDLIRRGEENYTYSKQTKDLINSRSFIVTSKNNNTGYSLYKGSNSDGSDWGGQPDAAISGLGYGKVYIHNNIFENISNQVFARGYSKSSGDPRASVVPFKENLASFFINNTIINCGSSYAAKDNSLIYIDASAQSPTFIINNIFDNVNKSVYATIKGQEKEKNGYYVDYNIYLKQAGQYTGSSIPSNVAVWEQYGNNYANTRGEKYSTLPNWNNKSEKVFVSTIGTKGSFLPDVRIISGGNSNNTGMNYKNIGDLYQGFGQDPTGRSFAYDILGNYRTTNDIGAFGSVDIITQDNAEKPVITKQPVSVSVNSGANALFEVNASSEDQIGYEWWKSPYISDLESKIVDNSKYSGAASNKLTINNIQTEDLNVGYVCKVYNTKDKSNLWINSNIVLLTINSDEVSRLNQGNGLKVYLEGAYSNGKLKSILQTSDALPQFQPYEQSPWNLKEQNGSTDGKDSIVDWIIVEIRDDIRNTAQSKSALLLEDGKIINTDGSDFSMNNISSGDYYLAIRHRNHLDVMSAQKIKIENNASINYDFTVSQDLVYGTNPLAMLGDGKLAMFAGDTDANNVINNLDFGTVANNIPLKGYSNGDLDMNGVVNVLDYTYINKNIFKKTFIP